MLVLATTLSMLAVWRLTHMLQEEEGPFGLFSHIQAWAASRPDVNGGINHGFYCFYCLSIWVALPLAIVYAGSITSFFVWWLSLSAGAILIQGINDRLEQ